MKPHTKTNTQTAPKAKHTKVTRAKFFVLPDGSVTLSHADYLNWDKDKLN